MACTISWTLCHYHLLPSPSSVNKNFTFLHHVNMTYSFNSVSSVTPFITVFIVGELYYCTINIIYVKSVNTRIECTTHLCFLILFTIHTSTAMITTNTMVNRMYPTDTATISAITRNITSNQTCVWQQYYVVYRMHS